jgi:hypothetical protein
MKVSKIGIDSRFDFWNNQYNATLVEYYLYLGCWFNIAFN